MQGQVLESHQPDRQDNGNEQNGQGQTGVHQGRRMLHVMDTVLHDQGR